MKVRGVIVPAALAVGTVAQINLSSLFSEAQSLYTVVTSALGDSPSSTSSSTTSSSSSTRTSSTSSTTTSSENSSASTAIPSSISSVAAQSATSSATATPAAANDNGGGGGGSNTLPIVLGCTLGALALAAFLALFCFCRRRSKRSKRATKHRPLSPSDDESDTWVPEKSRTNSFKGPTERTRSLGQTHDTTAAHYISPSYPAHQQPYGQQNHVSSFPAPMPAKQATPNVHHQNAHSNTFSSHPYSPDDVRSYGPAGPVTARNPDGVSTHNNVAAGLGGAALGGLATYAVSKDGRRSESRSRKSTTSRVDSGFSENDPNTLPQMAVESSRRRSGSVGKASLKEPWPFVDAHEHQSNDYARSRPRSTSRGQEHFPVPDHHTHDSHSVVPSGAALGGAAAAGGLLGAAATRKSGSRSPYRKGILKQTTPVPSSSSTSPDNDWSADRTSRQSAGPHELAHASIPPIVRGTLRDEQRGPLGTTAPSAASGANHSPNRARRRSWSSSPTRASHQSDRRSYDSQQDRDIPTVPNRSPRRGSRHSNARYSTANEGTVELPGNDHPRASTKVGCEDPISPSLEAQPGPVDSDGIVSPVTPDGSVPGTWSKAQAEGLGMNSVGIAAKSSSQESTAVESTPLNSTSNSSSSTSSKEQSSGLVSAIQRIFNSQKQAWQDEESANTTTQRRSLGDGMSPSVFDVYSDSDNRQMSSVPRRKPAPIRTSNHESQHGEIFPSNRESAVEANESSLPDQQQTASRQSGESARSVPLSGGRYYARVNSLGENDRPAPIGGEVVPPTSAPNSATPTTDMNTARQRSNSRPRSGYGHGSGDPFDLARVRTDSSMTGISLSNYTEPKPSIGPVGPRPRALRSSSSSNDYRQPTLAELKREVEEEDRQRRASWKSSRRSSAGSGWRKSTEGQRYGDDSELFNLAFPGVEQFDHFYGQINAQQGRGHTSVGRAY